MVNKHSFSHKFLNANLVICFLISLIMFLVAPSPAFGQNSGHPINHGVRADKKNKEVEHQIIAVDDRRLNALRQGNPEPLRQIYADDYTLVTPSGEIHSKMDQINDLISGRVHFDKLELLERKVRVYGDVAIVLSRENSGIIQGGQSVGGDTYLTRTYKKVGSTWHVISTHGCFVKK